MDQAVCQLSRFQWFEDEVGRTQTTVARAEGIIAEMDGNWREMGPIGSSDRVHTGAKVRFLGRFRVQGAV